MMGVGVGGGGGGVAAFFLKTGKSIIATRFVLPLKYVFFPFPLTSFAASGYSGISSLNLKRAQRGSDISRTVEMIELTKCFRLLLL